MQEKVKGILNGIKQQLVSMTKRTKIMLAVGAAAVLAVEEFLISLPFLLVVFPVYRWVHQKTAIDY